LIKAAVENKGYIGLHGPVIQALDLLWLPCSRLERVSAEENMSGQSWVWLMEHNAESHFSSKA